LPALLPLIQGDDPGTSGSNASQVDFFLVCTLRFGWLLRLSWEAAEVGDMPFLSHGSSLEAPRGKVAPVKAGP